jgi:predicted nucleotidyltransferase
MKELFTTNIGSHMWKMNRPESDIDLFVGVLASTKSYLQGKPDFTYSKISGDPGAVGQEDRNTHELGKIVEQLLKNNWNFITGIMSPIVVKKWDRLDELKDLLKINLSKQTYHSIHGLAIHNFRKYVQNERDDSEKRCNTIGRTILMGNKLLREGVIDFAPVSGVTPKDIPKFIDELDLALKESPLPDKPQNEWTLRNFLYDVRLESLWEEREIEV